jgi:GH35 family endo-1,4-beta-xylanase
MRHLARILGALWLCAAGLGTPVLAQTSVNGSNLVLRSTGSNQIASTGYVGTYLTVPDSGDGGSLVNLTLNATRGSTGTGDPHLNIVVADSKFGFDVLDSGAQNYSSGDVWLPAGTHFVRVERDSPGNAPADVNRNLTINTLSTSAGAFNNFNSTSNAINAANTYIDHFRKGSATIHLSGVPSGTPVHVQQVSRDFNFGAAVAGTTPTGVNSFLNNSNYREKLLENFNMVVPENAGKWAHSQPTFDIQGMDAIMQFAEANGLGSRMHNLIWQSQQPNSINTLISQAIGGDANAKTQLRQAITGRIDYYVQDRANRYTELDVLNEALRSPAYWNIFTPAEVAGIYAEVRDAVSGAGAEVDLYINDYNILQHNNDPITGQTDSYANWHRNHAELLNNQGFGEVVSGIGIQYYVRDDGSVSAPRIQQVFQNMGVTGMPLTLTEFGIQSHNNPTGAESADYLEQAMRMVFGTSHATTFIMWGFWQDAIWSGAPNGALYDEDWELTAVGLRYQQLMDSWTTEESLTVGADGTIGLHGFYGDYEITIDGQVYAFSLTKGVADGSIAIAPGDYNTDGIVDAADYVLWRKFFGPSGLWADGNGDGQIDEADFGVWQANYGNNDGSGTSGSSNVPEPAAVVLCFVSAICGVYCRPSGIHRSASSL